MTANSERAPTRLVALDLLKGWLVLLMVLYHWLNYFLGPQGDYYKYLRFITPSFIFLAGFLVAHLYLRKYQAGDPRLRGRLLHRGFRLLLVFLVLNVAALAAFNGLSPAFGSEVLAFFVEHAARVFLLGGGKSVAFPILVPISYLLMYLGLHVWLTGGRRAADVAVTVALFGASYVLRREGWASGYLELFTFGMMGLIFGRLSPETLQRLATVRWEIALIWVCYLIWLTEWNEILPMQVLGVLATLALLYSWIANSQGTDWWQRRVVTLGSYSLPAYIAQIGILILLARLLPREPFAVRLIVSFVAAFALTSLAVEVTAWLRQRAKWVDATYRFVFG